MIIEADDVYRVADSLGMEITKDIVDQVLEQYESEQRADPSGTWDLVVEHILYQLIK